MTLLMIVLACGCKPKPSISVHKIPKDVSGLEGLRAPARVAPNRSGPAAGQPLAATAEAGTPTRMVVAWFQRPDAAWFFKVNGAPEKVAATEPQWQKFFDDLTFDIIDGDKQPVWKLPEGWTIGPKAPFRFATIVIPDSPLEIRVSRLGGQQELLSNVNRWRVSQLGLPAATADNIDENFENKKGRGGGYLLFDQEGKSSGQSMGGPFMNRVRQAAARPEPKTSTTAPKVAAAAPKFDLVPPAGFELGKTSPMVVARFVQETDEGNVQISVVPLTAINNWNDNVNFWRQSVGLEKLGDVEVEEETRSVTVSDIQGQRIEMLEDHDGSDQGLIGVMVKKDDLAWFFKMVGPREKVRENQERFNQFLKDFSFKQ